jgi:hypothetical protein
MVCPITGGKSYVDETGKSMKAVKLELSPNDSWRKIAITLIDRGSDILNECNRLLAEVTAQPGSA